VNYFDFVGSIDPAGKTFNGPEGVQRIDQYLGSAEELVGQIVDELKSGALLPGDAPEGILSYLKFIAELVSEMRQTLAQLSFEDSSKSGEIGVQLSRISDLKRESVLKQFESMYEKLELQEHMQYIEHFMNILNPIMGSFSIVVAMVMLPINPVIGLILLGVAIGWFVITTALNQTGKMDDLFDEINKLIEGSLGHMLENWGVSDNAADGWSKAIFWITFLTVAVAAVAILGAAPFLGAVIPAILMPMIMTVLTESGLLDLIMGEFQDLTGISDIWKAILTGAVVMAFSFIVMIVSEISGIISEIQTEIIKLIVGFVIEFIVLIVKAIVSVVTAGVGAVVSAIIYVIKIVVGIISTVMKFLKTISTILKMLIQFANKIGTIIMKAVKKLVDATRSVLKTIESVMKWIKEFMETLKDLFEQTMDALEKISKKIGDAIKTIKESTIGKFLQQIREYFKKAKEMLNQIQDVATNVMVQAISMLSTLTQTSAQGVQAVVSAGLGGLQLKMAELTEEEGALEALIKILTDLIKSLEALLAKIQGKHSGEVSGDEFTNQIKQIANMFQQLLENMSGVSEELAASAVV